MHISLPFLKPKRRQPPPPARRIGLALSGGAVRGIAHVGVLEILEREGIRPDYVAGVSAGSLVGALYCAGYTPAQIKTLALEMRWGRLARPCRPHLSLFDADRLEQQLNELLGGKTFDQLAIPFAALSVDILTSESVTLRAGSVARAVRASCALPGIFQPVEWDGRLLIDGGILNNVPVSLAREMGADYIIAVSLANLRVSRPRPRNVLEVWLASLDLLARQVQQEAALADCLIIPDVEAFNLADFRNASLLLERGRQAAEAHVERLRSDLGILLPASDVA